MLGSFFEEQARALKKNGHQVGILFQIFFPFSEIFKKKLKYPGYYDDNGIPTIIYSIQGIVPRTRKFNDIYEVFFSNRRFKKYVKQFGMPDIIHAHSIFDAGLFGIDISKRYHIPLVITEHLTHYITGKLSLDHDIPLAQKIFSETDCCLVVGTLFKEELAKAVNLPSSTFKVVFNMVSDLFFTNIKEKKYQQGEEFIFFTNSFLNPRKNHQLLFKSLKKILEKGFKAKLIVGGFGETEMDLRALVNEYGLQQNVEFTGSLSRDQVKENIDNCHGFLLGSTYETFGVVLIEVLAGGKPIITTDSGGPRDIIKNEALGFLLKSFEVEEFASAMEYMITNYSDYNQLEISNYALEHFSENVISQQLVEIYNELIQKKKLI